MSADTVYLTRADVGLVHWDEFRKPPYSVQDYTDAYNNGVNMVAAIIAANTSGASKVVLERGNYPTVYANKGTGGDTVRESHTTIKGTTNLTIDGNGSCIFTIFDSNVRNPYHTNTKYLPHRLPGQHFVLEGNTNLTIKGFDLRGDQYNRSWIGDERFTEQTYGIFIGRNNINTKIDITGRGFRGDAISGSTKGVFIHMMREDWAKGGLSTTTGLPLDEAGAYKTPKIDLSEHTIYRNAIQVQSSTFIQVAEFREDRFRVFFYDAEDTFISQESSYQCDFIYLPVNCRYVQIVAYGDERTTDTVSYGNSVSIVSGSSEYLLVQGEYYANHRGAISNTCGYTTVDANIHDNGTLKYGFPHYDNGTRYGINLEDTYANKLTVRGSIKKCPQGVLFTGRILDIDHAEIRDINTSAIGAYNSTEVSITNSVIENIGFNSVVFTEPPIENKKGIVYNVSNNTFKNCVLRGDYSSSKFKGSMTFSGNIFEDAAISLKGNNDNLIFDNNTLRSVKGQLTRTASILGALRATANTLIVNKSVNATGWQAFGFQAKHSYGNRIETDTEASRFDNYYSAGTFLEPRVINGLTLVNTKPVEVSSVPKLASGDEAHLVRINDCNFLGDYISIGSAASRARIAKLDILVEDTKFKGGSSVTAINQAIALSIRETETTGIHTCVFKNCIFDVTYANYVLHNFYGIKGKLDIKFINCTFISDTPKRLRFVYCYDGLANITARAIGCEFINVVNGK